MKNSIKYIPILFIAFVFIIGNSVYANEPSTEKISLTTNKNVYATGESIYFFVQIVKPTKTNSAVIYVDIINPDNKYVKGEIYHLHNNQCAESFYVPDSLRTGLYTLRVYTNYMRNYNGFFEKKVYISSRFGKNQEIFKGITQIDLNDTLLLQSPKVSNHITIQPFKTTFKNRELAKIGITATNLPDTAFCTIRVNYKSKLETAIEHENNSISQHNNNLHYVHNNIFQYEKKGLLLTGRLIHTITKNPIINAVVTAATIDSSLNFYSDLTCSSGEFQFLIENLHGDKTLHFSAFSAIGLVPLNNVAFEIYPKRAQTKPIITNKNLISYANSLDTINTQIAHVYKAYSISANNTANGYTSSNINAQLLPGANLFIANIDDYILLNDFAEIIKEIVPFLRLKKSGSKIALSLYNPNKQVWIDNPFVFIDGVPATGIDKISNWGSNKIESIQVQTSPRVLGNVAFENGIVFIYTKQKNFWYKNSMKGVTALNVKGYSLSQPFNKKRYSIININLKTPDFRTTLLWKNFKIAPSSSKKFNFYTSDLKGSYSIIVEGFTIKGKPIKQVSTITIN